jgi:phosphoribosylformylglycinamidine synthase II
VQELFTEKEVTTEDALEHGLTAQEFENIKKTLGRTPTTTELGIYSGLWSEHCSYKNSILLLKTLPTESKRTAAKTGEENAGALDIGDGLAVVFKIESHNHPTAVEPYQGAATGVGGIMRDIFTMGARPICSLNSLRFGPPSDKRSRYLLSRAVKGIGDYGNSLGIPVAGGEILFDESFTRNCLVNAMTVGIVEKKRIVKARAEGEGNPVFYVGARTGRDGIHGASFASKDLTQESESKRSAVQVGDPFMEKLLMEASLELAATDCFTGMQDMGAAGLSCATSEMSAKGQVGMDINLDLVPLREKGMNAYEIMLSESQERMLVVGKRGQEETIVRIFQKWGLEAVEIGQVTKGGRLRIFSQGRLCADIPAENLVLGGGAPRYERPVKRPAYLDQVAAASFAPLSEKDAGADLLAMLGAPNLASRRPVIEQYDSEVGLARVIGPGGDGGVSRVPGTNKGIAVSTDCNSRYVYLDPRKGAAQAVFESARNVACTGAEPIGITNCLNFGNPMIPENYYVFSECIAGMAEACRSLGVPVTGGNVSFYNESQDGPVFPTPTIGMVGLLENIEHATVAWFKSAGRRIYLAGDFKPSAGGSEYLKLKTGKSYGTIPELNFESEKRLIEFLGRGAPHIESARDLSIGGLALALARSVLTASFDLRGKLSAKGFRVNLAGLHKDLAMLLFGETNGCAIVTPVPGQEDAMAAQAAKAGVNLVEIGQTTGEAIFDFGSFQTDAAAAAKAFENGLKSVFA